MTLTPNQEKALNSLLAGNSVERAAVAANVSRSTIWRWQKEEPFSTAYSEIRHQDFLHSLAHLQGRANDAISTLVTQLTCGNPAREIRAAVTILKHAMRAAEQDLQHRLEKAETLLEKLENSPDSDATPGAFHAQNSQETFQNVAYVAAECVTASNAGASLPTDPRTHVPPHPPNPVNPVETPSSPPQPDHSATSVESDAQILSETLQNVANVAAESVTTSKVGASLPTHPQTHTQPHIPPHLSNPVNPVKSVSSHPVAPPPGSPPTCLSSNRQPR